MDNLNNDNTGDIFNNGHTAEELKNLDNYTEEQQHRIRDIFETFSIPENPDLYLGFSYLSDDDISRLKRIYEEKGLKINSTNIFAIAGTDLTGKEIDFLKDWQQQGIEVKTREMLFGMLSGYDESAEIVHIANGLKIDEFFNNYFEENGIVKSNINGDDEDCKVDWKSLRDEFIQRATELRVYDPKEDSDLSHYGLELSDLDWYTNDDEDFIISDYDEFLEIIADCSNYATEYLENHENVSEALKRYLQFIIDFKEEKVKEREFSCIIKEIESFGSHANNNLTFDDLCKNFDYLSLVRLFFFLKITDQEPTNQKEVYDLLYNVRDYDLQGLYYLYKKGIDINGIDVGLFERKKFNKNNLEFIFKYFIREDCISPLRLIHYCGERIDTINLLAEAKKQDTIENGGKNVNNVFVRLKSHFPNIDFDNVEVIKKLARCNVKMFDENNIEFILKHFIQKDGEDLFEDYVSCNETIELINGVRNLANYLPNINFADPEIRNKLKSCKPEMFNEDNLEFIFNLKHFIQKDGEDSLRIYLSCNEIIEIISEIVKNKVVINTELLDLLADRFGIKQNKLLGLIKLNGKEGVFDYGKFYKKLNKVVDSVDNFLGGDSNKFDFIPWGRDIAKIVEFSQDKENIWEQLICLNDFDLSGITRDEYRDKLSSLYGTEPFKMDRKLDFLSEELEEKKALSLKIEKNNAIIQDTQERIKGLRAIINNIESENRRYKDRIKEIDGASLNRYRVKKESEYTKKEKHKQGKLEDCKSLFNSGINEENFGRIFEEYFDIVFDGKRNNFLELIPENIINRTDFIDGVVTLSFGKDKVYLIFPLLKYLTTTSSFETVYKLMTERGYLGSLIYGVAEYVGKESQLFEYILSKYGEMKNSDKVRLLPYLSGIKFSCQEEFEEFMKGIVSEFGTFCLRPHFNEIIGIEERFDELYPLGEYSFYKERNNYNFICKESCKIGFYNCDDIYVKGSGRLFCDDGISNQKFILGGEIIDSQNINFYLSTKPVRYHKYLCGSGECFGGGFLFRDGLDKKIYVYGYSVDFGGVHTKLYPIITDILGREFPEYEVVFGNPNYYGD